MSDLLLARVRKLLAKAEDPACTSAEAEAFTAKATELIAKYGVDRALLAAQDPAIDPVGDRIVPLDAPYALDKAGLLAAVAVPLGCRVVRRTRDGVKVHLFGHDADLERVELLFTSLLVQAAHGLAAVRVPPHEHAAAFRRSWLAGFAHAIGAPGAELVLVRRPGLVDQRMAEAYPRLRTAGRRRLAGGGVEHGYAAGRAA